MGPLLGALSVAPLIVSQAGFSAPFIFLVCVDRDVRGRTDDRALLAPAAWRRRYLLVCHSRPRRAAGLPVCLAVVQLLLRLRASAAGGDRHLRRRRRGSDVLGVDLTGGCGRSPARRSSSAWRSTGIACRCASTSILAVIADGFLLLISLMIIAKVIGDGDFTLEPLAPTNAPADLTGLVAGARLRRADLPRVRAVFVLGEEISDRMATCRRRSTRRWRWSAACCSCHVRDGARIRERGDRRA